MTSALALLLALRLATGDAGASSREVDEVKTGSLELVDGTHRDVAGGAWLPDSSMVATAKELALLRAEKATWDAQPAPSGPPPSLVLIVIVGVVGAVLGAGLVIAAKH